MKNEEETNQTEQVLHKYAFIVDSTPDLMSFVDKDYHYQAVNEAYLRAHQKMRNEIIGHSVAELHGEEVFNTIIKPEIDRCLAGEQIRYGSWFDYAGLGARFVDVTYNPYRDKQDAISGMVVSVHDITERKLIEEALEESEERHKQISDLIADYAFSCVKHPGGEFVIDWLVGALENITGYTVDEVKGQGCFRFLVHPLDIPLFEKNVIGLNPGEKSDCELRIVRKDGLNRWMRISTGAFEDNKSPLSHRILGCCEDITERRRAEEELQESERKFHSVFDSMSEMVVLHELVCDSRGLPIDYRILDCNPAFMRGTGIPSEQAVGALASQLYGASEPPYLETYANAALTGKAEQFEVYFAPMKKHFAISVVGLGKGRFATVTTDITGRKRSEEVLKESEQRYRELFEAGSDAMLLVDNATALILEANSAASAMYGYSREELLTKTNWDLSEEPEETLRITLEAKATPGRVITVPLRYLRKKDGTIFPVEITARSFIWHKRSVHIAAIRDITDRKRAEEEKDRLEAQLNQAQKLEAIGTLAGGIAHDFNNVLSAIIGYTEMAFDDIPEESPVRNDLQQVLKASQRAKDLVRQILVFSRKKGEKERVPTKISPIIKEAVKLLRASLPSTIEIKRTFMVGEDRVLADPTQIHQVLVNLCTNAAHAMEEDGGVLEVGLADLDIHEKTVTPYGDLEPGSYLKISVTDNGCGMDEETVKCIFDPYFTTKEVGKGSGLGLAVVHGIVKRHRGIISVQSTPGTGTRFEVYLPKIQAEAIPEVGAGTPIPEGVERVLFIDDEEPLSELGGKMLQSLGYTVTACTNSTEALTTFSRQPDQFDLVITDFTMPHMTGADLARQMLRVRPDIPIILCTGFSERISEDTLRDLGISELLMKPITRRVIAETIRKVLDGK